MIGEKNEEEDKKETQSNENQKLPANNNARFFKSLMSNKLIKKAKLKKVKILLKTLCKLKIIKCILIYQKDKKKIKIKYDTNKFIELNKLINIIFPNPFTNSKIPSNLKKKLLMLKSKFSKVYKEIFCKSSRQLIQI